jgi:biopolymer transport protein ExbB
MEVLSLLLAGGPFMFATLAVSLVSLGVFIWRVAYFWLGSSKVKEALAAEVVALTEGRDYAQAIRLCASSQSPVARVMKAALLRADRTEKEIRRAVESCLLEEAPKVKAGTVYLPQLSNLATLLGLIGTIHGLIVAFQGAASENVAARQAILSKGISIAFYNTFFGLVVATVVIFFYLVLFGKANHVASLLEKSAAQIIDAIVWHRDAGNPKKG